MKSREGKQRPWGPREAYGFGVKVQHRMERGPSCHLWRRPRHLSDMTRSGIFRATGENTHGRVPGDVMRNIFYCSPRKASLAGFKESKNMMDATGLIVT